MNRQGTERQLLEVIALALAFLGAPQVSLAQRAQINGRILDSSSAVIIGAKITVTDVETGVERSATSN
jgi:hypothetical protein